MYPPKRRLLKKRVGRRAVSLYTHTRLEGMMGIAAAGVGREVPGGSQAPEDEGSLGIKPRRGGVWG